MSAIMAVFAVALAVVAAPSQAQEAVNKGWFVELGIGGARDRNDMGATLDVTNTNYMKRGYLGYRFSEWMGVQGGFLGVDGIEYTDTATGIVDTYKYEGYHGKFNFNIPFNRDGDGFFGFALSAGGWRWDAKVLSPTANKHTTGFSPTAGIGLIFSGRSSAIKLEYERFWTKPEQPSGVENNLKYDALTFSFLFYM
jgi:hypothetical protein